MKKTVMFIFGFLFMVSLAFGQLLINEADADTPGTDVLEFIELYDGGVGNTPLDGYVVVLYNGNGDVSYNAFDLDTYSTDANGYFLLGNAAVVPTPSIIFASNGLQNGADAVALYLDDATSFPNGTAVTTTSLIDALVYDTDDADDAGLLVLLNASEPQINENENGNKDLESMQRSPNGSGGARNTSTYTTDISTPGAQNPDPPASATITGAYSRSSTRMTVIYDMSMTSVNPADYTLTGTSTITFTTATIDGTDDKIVYLTGGSPAMVTDLTLDNIDDTVTNLDFYAGIMPISNSNTNNPTRATMLNGYYATFQGIISANDDYNNVWISDASGAYNGVMIYSSSFDALVSVGDEVIIAAQRDVYNGLTELVSPILEEIISSSNTPHGPTVINGSDISETLSADTNPGESWEGQLVEIQNVYVESEGSYYYRCTDDGGTTYFYVGDNVDFQLGVFSLIVGETYQKIVGVVDWYNSGPYYRINPRDNDDQVLPVTLSNFTAQFINDNLTILWTTQSETNNLGWNIYRGETENALENNTTFCINNSGLIPGAGTTSEPTNYQFTDEYDVTVGQTYWYWLETVDGGGDTDTYGPASLTIPEEEPVPQLPQNTFLCSNYPNPFNPETKIEFSIKEGENGSLNIYNMKGQLLETYQYEAGEHKLTWDAIQYGSGIYFYKLETQSYTETKKMIMLK